MKKILAKCRQYIIYIGMISFVIDMLSLTPALFMMNTFDRVLASRSNETLAVLLLIALYALVVQAVLDGLRSRLFNRFGITLQKVLSPFVLENSLKGIHHTELTQHGLEDVNELQSFLTGSGIRAFFELPWIPIYWGVLYLCHPALAAAGVVISLMLSILTKVEDRLTSANQRRATELARRANDFALTARQNSEAVSSLGMQSAITARWSKLNGEFLDHTARVARYTAAIHPLARFLRVGGQIITMAIAVFLLINVNDISPGIIIASTIIMGRAMGPIDHLIGAWKSFIGARAAYGRLSKIVEQADADAATKLKLPIPVGEIFVERLIFMISRERRILSGIHFKLPAGQALGIIGPSGSGKTTLARLLVGLYKPTDGHVRLDGADVYQWAQSDLGQHIGYLPQNVVLFAGTVAENIARMQDPELHSEAIVKAAKQARIHDVILRLPQGYNTEVGEGGAMLSGGQRQLVGLARALFGNPKLIVLDEPNASLDSTAEAALIDVIRELKDSNVTVVVIAHKPSLVRDVDRLLVLRGGEQKLFGPNLDVLRELNAQRDKKSPSQPAPQPPEATPASAAPST